MRWWQIFRLPTFPAGGIPNTVNNESISLFWSPSKTHGCNKFCFLVGGNFHLHPAATLYRHDTFACSVFSPSQPNTKVRSENKIVRWTLMADIVVHQLNVFGSRKLKFSGLFQRLYGKYEIVSCRLKIASSRCPKTNYGTCELQLKAGSHSTRNCCLGQLINVTFHLFLNILTFLSSLIHQISINLNSQFLPINKFIRKYQNCYQHWPNFTAANFTNRNSSSGLIKYAIKRIKCKVFGQLRFENRNRCSLLYRNISGIVWISKQLEMNRDNKIVVVFKADFCVDIPSVCGIRLPFHIKFFSYPQHWLSHEVSEFSECRYSVVEHF